MNKKQKTLFELLRDRPRWTRFQNFDVESSLDTFEDWAERVEKTFDSLVAELKARRDDYQKQLESEQKEYAEEFNYDCKLTIDRIITQLTIKIKELDWVLLLLDSAEKKDLTKTVWLCYNPRCDCDESEPNGVCCISCANVDSCQREGKLCDIIMTVNEPSECNFVTEKDCAENPTEKKENPTGEN